VYVEKPLANSIGECDAMVAAAQRYGRVVQVGQQQRSAAIWHSMKAYIDSGELGHIGRVNVWANFAYAALLNPAKDGPVPDGIDFDMWLGPAPKRTFNASRFHGSWRMFWDYGGGLLTDWGVHLLDMALWGMDVKGMPQRVIAAGGNHAYPNNFSETFDTLSVTYQFPEYLIQWSNLAIESGPYGRNYGLEFKGTNGTLIANRESWEVIPQGDKIEAKLVKPSNNDHLDHTNNFMECVKHRDMQTACPITNGSFCAKYAHIGNIAARTHEVLTYDDTKHTFHNKAADRYITPDYRKPWKL
jgi:predicted dehydrogenase